MAENEPAKPRKKRSSAKSGAKSSAKKASASGKRTVAKKSAARKSARTGSRAKTTAKAKKPDALHNVARSIGSTLGTLAKKATDAVQAAKDALPERLRQSGTDKHS